MAIRIIRTFGDEMLRKKSRRVENVNHNIHLLLDDMIETMRSANGVGLAASQVGVLKRVIVIDIGEGLIELINPEIVSADGTQIEIEGCLSVPGKMGEVIRPSKVTAKGIDRNGEHIEIAGEGLLARAICHEIDHLNGDLFIDKVIKYVDPKEL